MGMGEAKAAFYPSRVSEQWQQIPSGLLKLPHAVMPTDPYTFRGIWTDGTSLPEQIGLILGTRA